MKRLVIFILAILLFSPITQAEVVRNIQDNHQVIYHIIDTSGNHVSGQTVTLKIKRISDGYWYDFNDDTFKNSGWTSKSTNLSEDATEGYYYYTFDPPASETSAEQYLFLVDNSDATYGDHQSKVVCYQDIGNSDFDYSSNDVGLSSTAIDNIWDELQSEHTTAGTFGKYLDSEISGITASISDADIDKIWDEALADHLTAGSTGEKLNNIPESGTGDWTTDERTYIKEALSIEDGSVDVDLDALGDATDGDKENGSYTGIERLIRIHR